MLWGVVRRILGNPHQSAVDPMQSLVPAKLAHILSSTPELRSAYLVGGCVRDWLLDKPVNDFDIEVFGMNYERLTSALVGFGQVDLVGRSFGVLKLAVEPGVTFDFSLPRRESKHGIGHKGFSVELDPGITLQEAAARRDFTINALMFDPREARVLDFFGGQDDLRNNVLKHTTSLFRGSAESLAWHADGGTLQAECRR